MPCQVGSRAWGASEVVTRWEIESFDGLVDTSLGSGSRVLADAVLGAVLGLGGEVGSKVAIEGGELVQAALVAPGGVVGLLRLAA